MDVLHFIFGVFGNAFALFLFLAPTITFKRIITKKSTEQFSGIPYVMTLLNCLLSAWYGLPFVSPNNILVSTINGTGAAIESIYVLLFIIFAPKREKAKIFGLFAFVLTVFATVALVSLLALHAKPRKLFCGLAATIFSIVMYASPLSIMRTVIKTKSVEFMPFSCHCLSSCVALPGSSMAYLAVTLLLRCRTASGVVLEQHSLFCTSFTVTGVPRNPLQKNRLKWAFQSLIKPTSSKIPMDSEMGPPLINATKDSCWTLIGRTWPKARSLTSNFLSTLRFKFGFDLPNANKECCR